MTVNLTILEILIGLLLSAAPLCWALVTMYFDIRALKKELYDLRTSSADHKEDFKELKDEISKSIKEFHHAYTRIDKKILQLITIMQSEKGIKVPNIDE